MQINNPAGRLIARATNAMNTNGVTAAYMGYSKIGASSNIRNVRDENGNLYFSVDNSEVDGDDVVS